MRFRLAASAVISLGIAVVAAVPVMAAGHGRPAAVNQRPAVASSHGQAGNSLPLARPSAAASHAVTLPSVSGHHGHASSSPPARSSSNPAPSSSTTQIRAQAQGQTGNKRPSHPTGHSPSQSSAVLADVKRIKILRQQIAAARQKYVTAVQTYIRAVANIVAHGGSANVSLAINQLKTINTVLAHTVKNEMAAHHAQQTTGQNSGPQALSNVLAKFNAELKALTTDASQVHSLTVQIVSTSAAKSSASSHP